MPKRLILGWLPGAKRPGKRHIYVLVTQRATHLELAVDVGSDPITGSVAVGGGLPVDFCGWIELVSAIESVRHNGHLASSEVSSATSAEAALG